MKSNYLSFKEKIQSATDEATISAKLDRLWNNGIFTVSEFQRLDALICDKFPK